jgi:hypothetical protein
MYNMGKERQTVSPCFLLDKVVPLRKELPARPHNLFWSCGVTFFTPSPLQNSWPVWPSGRHDIKSGHQVRKDLQYHHCLVPSQRLAITASYQLHVFADHTISIDNEQKRKRPL